MADVLITDQNFQQQVQNSKIPVLVDFWAPWCQPCKMLTPIVEELAKEYDGKVVVGKLNVDENPDVASQFNVMSIPTVIVFKNGQPEKSFIGVQKKETYKQAIEESLN